MDAADKLEVILRYHERTKHQFHRYARSAGAPDWVKQPNPLRRYEYREALFTHGPWLYRQIFWETGVFGQVLYLEAEAAGIGATGIGCFFDDPVHRVFGFSDLDFQSLYHFTIGGPVEDRRLTSLAPYGVREEDELKCRADRG